MQSEARRARVLIEQGDAVFFARVVNLTIFLMLSLVLVALTSYHFCVVNCCQIFFGQLGSDIFSSVQLGLPTLPIFTSSGHHTEPYPATYLLTLHYYYLTHCNANIFIINLNYLNFISKIYLILNLF